MWEALVALGTLGLGAATFWLGWHTRNLARSSAAELQAQWRPIVLPATSSPEQLTPDRIGLGDGGRLQVAIRNAGRGPALFVRTELDPGAGATAEHGAIAAMAVGDLRFLTFQGVQRDQHVQLLVDYRDLAGRPYSTSITLDLQNRAPYDVQPFPGFVTHHGARYTRNQV
jgi:hypothetical protein